MNRLAFSQGHELQPYGATAVAVTPGWLRSEMMLDNFGVDRGATGATPSTATAATVTRSPTRTSPSRSRRATSAGPSRRWPPIPTGPLEPAIGRLRPARARVRLHRRRRLAARRLGIGFGGDGSASRRETSELISVVEDTVLGMWKALSDRDWDSLKTYLSDDCIYLDVPVGSRCGGTGTRRHREKAQDRDRAVGVL